MALTLDQKNKIALNSLIDQGITVRWSDPDPIEEADNFITKVVWYSGDSAYVEIGMADVEIFTDEISIDSEQALNRLYELTQVEVEKDLTELQGFEYVYLYHYLIENSVEIPFGVIV